MSAYCADLLFLLLCFKSRNQIHKKGFVIKIGFIGDIVGRPGRAMLKTHLFRLRKKYALDLVIANYENASHGFGLSVKNAKELFACGADVLTGGNHTWDKKDIIPMLDTHPILRPINYSNEVAGKGLYKMEVAGEKLAIISVMGIFSMPYTSNPFVLLKSLVQELRDEEYYNIFIDFHAEATSEKRAIMMMLQSQVSAIIGTHTHIGTDDLEICQGTAYATDIGLTGCHDSVIGLDEQSPIKKFLTGLHHRYEVNNHGSKILQMIVLEMSEGVCSDAFKLKAYNEQEEVISMQAMRY